KSGTRFCFYGSCQRSRLPKERNSRPLFQRERGTSTGGTSTSIPTHNRTLTLKAKLITSIQPRHQLSHLRRNRSRRLSISTHTRCPRRSRRKNQHSLSMFTSPVSSLHNSPLKQRRSRNI